MTPIEKNVIVVDSQGNILEATYPKRAKGLVKNGRARFIDDNKICLACPPKNLEDNKMTDKMMDMTTGEVIEMTSGEPKLSVEYILAQLEKISSQTAYLNEAIAQISGMQVAGSGDIGTQGKASAIADVVKCRETTNQKLISLYEKMYDQITYKESPREDKFKEKIDAVSKLLCSIDCDDLDGDDIVRIVERFI